MAWKKLLTEDDFGGFANPSGTIGGAAVNGAATTAMRSDAAPALGPLTRDLDFGAFKGVNAADPTGAQHLATKAYVDSVAQGLAPKESVRLATAAALPGHTRAGSTLTASANGALSIDGVAVNNGDRVLVKNEGASHLEHGIYTVTDKGSGGTPWVLDRAADADSEGDLLSASVFVQEGASNFDSLWVMTTDAPIVVNATALTWSQFAGAGDIVGGAGLTKTGNTLDVNVDGSTLEINADALRVKALGITDAHIAAANKDGVVGTPSLRTLGTGSQQAAAGNDGRLSDTRVRKEVSEKFVAYLHAGGEWEQLLIVFYDDGRLLDEYSGFVEDYLRTEFRAKDSALKQALEREIDRPLFLAQEPFFQAHRPFKAGKQWRELPLDARLATTMAERSGTDRAYVHQSEAISRLLAADAGPVVVTTGTGSGKSEAFLLPVIQNAFEDSVRFKRPGLTAILVYPMNALANDQHQRIQAYLESAGFSGAVDVRKYDRGTPQEEREAMRRRPPHILLTNYMMLEYLLVRPADREGIFANHRCRFLALDEVHTYRGTLGSNIALLVRRVRAHLARATHDWLPDPPAADRPRRFPTLVPVGTSATIKSVAAGAASPEDQRRARDAAVQGFFGKLSGVPPESVVVLGEEIEDVRPPEEARYSAVIDAQAAHRHLDAATIRAGICRLAGVPDATPLDIAARRCRLLWDLHRWLVGRPMSLTDIAKHVRGEVSERASATDEDVRREVEAALVLGAAMPDGTPGALRLRAHRFIRGGWRFHRCVNPACGRIFPMGEERCGACDHFTAPLYLCRNCGADYLRFEGDPASGEPLRPCAGGANGGEWMLYEPSRFSGRVVRDDEEDDENGDEPPRRGSRKTPTQMKGRPVLDGSFDPVTCVFSNDLTAYPMKVTLAPARNRCLCCGGLAGSRNVITPVALGTSAAVKVLAEGLVESLAEAHEGDPSHDGKERLLVFSDSRQDAAHQARFIRFASRYDRMRRNVVELLTEHGALGFQQLAEKLGERGMQRHDNPYATSEGWLSPDDRDRLRAWEEAPLLDDLAVSAGYRGTLVNLGLVGVRYQDLDRYIRERGAALVERLRVAPEHLEFICRAVLDEMRVRGAFARDMLRYHPLHASYPRVYAAAEWERRVQQPKGFAATAAGEPASWIDRHEMPAGVSLINPCRAPSGRGRSPSVERIVKDLLVRFGGNEPHAADVEELLTFLKAGRFVVAEPLFGQRDSRRLLQVNPDSVRLELLTAKNRHRCEVCGAGCGGARAGYPCVRCHGALVQWSDADVRENRTVQRIYEPRVVPLAAEEHTAQVTHDDRIESERKFKAPLRESPVNLLACSPTLELGIDVGGLDAVVLRNVPPRPDNYAQRGGRAGRRTRVGLVVGYARNTPHDQYFYDRPAEMISGEIAAPALSLGNRDVILRHVHAIAFGAADPGLAGRMCDYVTAEGTVIQEKVDELVAAARAKTDYAVTLAVESFGSEILAEAGLSEQALREALDRLGTRVQDVVDRTARQVVELRAAIERYSRELMQRGAAIRSGDLVARILGIRTESQRTQIESDDRSAGFPMRRFAEFGILPGYEFPTEPAALRLLGDPHEDDPVSVARRFGIAQFQPDAQVYARGRRWKVIGLDTASPWNPRGDAPSLLYRVCRGCGLRFAADRPRCPRCSTDEPNSTHTAMEFGGFLARRDESPVLDEEERFSSRNLVQGYPQWNGDVVGRWSTGPGWALRLSRGEEVRWLNEGLPPTPAELQAGKPALHVEGRGYLVCGSCGRMLDPTPPATSRSGGRRQATSSRRDDPYGHADGCDQAGREPKPLAIVTANPAEIVRLILTLPPGTAIEDVRSLGLSLGYALRTGIRHLYMLDGPELEFGLEGPWQVRDERAPHARLALSFIDPSIGGTGYARRIAEEFHLVAKHAIDHLDHPGCETACYRCLKSYQNQRYHEFLRWPLAVPYLDALAASAPMVRPRETGDIDDPRPWLEAYAAGVGSPLELKFLRLFEAHGFHPQKQFPISIAPGGRPITIADFAVPERRIAIYVDGAAFHRGAALRRDKWIRGTLRSATPPWNVTELRASDLANVGSIIAQLRA